MSKFLLMVVVSIAALILTTGCSTSRIGSSGLEMGADLESGDSTICKTAIYAGKRSSDEIMKIIKIAGEKEGWRITPFKSNTVIAEKFIDGEMVSTTIKFAKEHISCTKSEKSEDELKILRAAIVDEIKKEDAVH